MTAPVRPTQQATSAAGPNPADITLPTVDRLAGGLGSRPGGSSAIAAAGGAVRPHGDPDRIAVRAS